MQGATNLKSSKITQNASSNNVSVPIIIAVVVIGVAVIGWSVWHFAQPAVPQITKYGTPSASSTNRLNELVAKSRGDVNALSPEEQAEANQITHGNAGMVFSVMYKGMSKN